MGKTEKLLAEFGDNIRQSVATKSQATPTSGTPLPPRQIKPREVGLSHLEGAFEIAIGQVVPDPDQPRTEFDDHAIESMSRSLKARGQLQPIAVRFSTALEKWVIVSGERRYRGALRAGLARLKAVERKGPPDESEILVDQLIENIVRENLEPLDEARAFRKLMDLNSWSGNQLAQELSISQPRVVERLSLLEAPAAIQDRVALGELSSSSAYEIGKLADPVVQEEVAARVVSEGLTRDQTREVVKEKKRASASESAAGGKGRGGKSAAKPKAPTSWTVKTSPGYRITIEARKGIDGEALAGALAEAAEKARSHFGATG